MLENGRTIDRFVVEAPLGEGGMAQVYRVRHASLGTLHALKVLTLTRTDLRERFLQEGRVQADLRHPNIVGVTDVLEVDSQPALLLEYVDGPTLGQWIAEGGSSDLATIERIFRDIVCGVAAAHEHGFVHRDLKPGNVLLAEVDGRWSARVADFGLAKVTGDVGVGGTRTNVAMGTPAYMAPEQIRDAKRVDARADIFSLGCILYEMICRRPAFQANDLLSLLTVVSNGTYRAPELLVEGLPKRFSVAIREALVVDADRRLPDCAALLATLQTGERPFDELAKTMPMTPSPLVPVALPEGMVSYEESASPPPDAPTIIATSGAASTAPPPTMPPVTMAPATVVPSTPPPSLAPVSSPVGVAAALTTVGALALVGVMLIVAAGAAWIAWPEPPAVPEVAAAAVVVPPIPVAAATAPADCVPGTPGRIGYAKVEQLRFGYTTTWSPGQPRPVFAQLDPAEGTAPACTLPADAIVTLVAPAEHLGGVWWVPIDGDAFTVGAAPQEAASDQASSEEAAASEPSGVHRPRPAAPPVSPPANPGATRPPPTPPAPAGGTKRPNPKGPGDQVDAQIQDTVEQVLDGIKAAKPKKPHP